MKRTELHLDNGDQNEQDRRLPSREVAYAYTVAMHFAQELESNLRAILYAAVYHGWGVEMELDERQKERFANPDRLIDEATCGLLIVKLEKVGIIPSKDAFKLFKRACEYRNELAHSFLAKQNFQDVTKAQERNIINELNSKGMDLYRANFISRGIRKKAETHADKIQDVMKEYGIENYDNPNRHYTTKKSERKTEKRGG